ncbi:acyltransferase family protein [Enterobacterales bacterium BD_CKDN230030183-1A_HGKHYDSX7]
MRNAAIDSARGLGILIVVLGHTPGIPPTLLKFIYSFHMPMFFVLSGYLFKSESVQLGAKLSSLLNRLIVPYFFIGLTCAIPSILTGHTASVSEFFARVCYTIYSVPGANYTFYATPIWFLTCLFCVELIYAYLYSRFHKLIGLSICISVITGLCVLRYLDYYFPWNIQLALVAVGFYHLGTMLRGIRFFERGRCSIIWILVSFGICYVAVINSTTKVDFSQGEVGDLLLFAVTTLSGSVGVLGLATWLGGTRVLTFFGLNTIFILGYNYWIIKLSTTILLGVGGWIGSFCLQLVLFALGIAIVNRFELLSSIFGRRRNNA